MDVFTAGPANLSPSRRRPGRTYALFHEVDFDPCIVTSVSASGTGSLAVASHDLRDIFLFRDSDGKMYLYYVGGGGKAVGVAFMESG